MLPGGGTCQHRKQKEGRARVLNLVRFISHNNIWTAEDLLDAPLDLQATTRDLRHSVRSSPYAEATRSCMFKRLLLMLLHDALLAALSTNSLLLLLLLLLLLVL
jgi:hypothetical protein